MITSLVLLYIAGALKFVIFKYALVFFILQPATKYSILRSWQVSVMYNVPGKLRPLSG